MRLPRLSINKIRRACNQRGTALVETAVIAPILMLVLVSSVSLASAARMRTTVETAAAAAARVAVVRPDLAAREARAVLKIASPPTRPGDIKTIVEEIASSTAPFMRRRRVTVTVSYQSITGFGWHPEFALTSTYVVDAYSGIGRPVRR